MAYVDYNTEVVRAGALSWPFALDLRTGAASLDFGGRRLAVRPLLWREKLALARFAHLGAAFTQRQFVTLALDGATPPVEEAAAEALAALALWVNAPDGQPGLPLDPRLLASVMLGVCRAGGLRPADLDSRPALEVELLWHASGSQPTAPERAPAIRAPADDPPSMIRILVQPDPAPEPREAAHAGPQPAQTDAAPQLRAARATPPAPSVDSTSVKRARSAYAAMSPAQPPAAVAIDAARAATPIATEEEYMPAPPRTAPTAASAPPFVEARYNGLPPRVTGGFRVTYLDALPALAPAAPTPPPAMARTSAPPSGAPGSPASAAAGAPVVPDLGTLAARIDTIHRPALPQLAPEERTGAQLSEWLDTMIEELGERLEQATAELGIDMED